MLHKSFQVLETKADGEHGEFTALVSTFGNIDRVGDRFLPGAWTKSLKKWADSGDPIPIILAHQWDDPMAHIGIAWPKDIKQVQKGLQVTGKLDVEDNPVAKQVYRLMKRRSLKEFSIGYDVPAGGESRAKDGANEIAESNLAECGPCLKGIDPKTELQAVKSALAVTELPEASAQQEAADRTAREVEKTRVPDLPEQPDPEPVEEPKADKPPDPPRDAEALKRESKRVELELERQRNDERIAALPALPALPAPEPKVGLAAELADVKSQLAETRRLIEEATKAPPVDPARLREQAKRVEREVEEIKIPNVPAPPKAPEPDLAKELQEVKATITEMAVGLEDLRSKANVTDKGPVARSVDSLRQQANAVALEIASDGMSLRKPPQTVAPKQPAPALTLAELKQRTRTEMLGVLSGKTIE